MRGVSPLEPLVSVVVPVYNVEKYLRQCVDSILDQTYRNLEVILVDDGSTDSSGEICDEYARKDGRVKAIHKPNGGSSSARNAGIDQAIGDRIIFLDSDDYWASNDFLAVVVRNCHSENIVVWGYQKCKEDETIVLESPLWKTQTFSLSADYETLLGQGILFASACFSAIPRAFFQSNGLRFALGETSEDVEWFAEFLSICDDFIFIDEPVYIYRTREGSISNSSSQKGLYSMRKHVLRLSDKYRNASKAMTAYISEQAANYIIILSRYPYSKQDISDSKNILHSLIDPLRFRSKMIKISCSLFGLTATLRLLRVLDFISRKK